MKKKGYILGFVMGLAICGGIVYADSLINANDVLYAPNNGDFNASTVKDALDTLYNMANDSSNYNFTYSKTIYGDRIDIDIHGNDNFIEYYCGINGSDVEKVTNGKCTFENLTVNNNYNILVAATAKDASSKRKNEVVTTFGCSQIPYEISYTGGETTFTPSCAGKFKVEVWGAQGGTTSNSHAGGYGAYAVGVLDLDLTDKLYINVGGQGSKLSNNTTFLAGGYNGGGGTISCSGCTMGTGGGATHVALVSGLLKDLESYKGTLSGDGKYYISDDILLVAAGGGGASTRNAWNCGNGGSGGGFTGVTGITGCSDSAANGVGTGGTQTTGGYIKASRVDAGNTEFIASFGQGARNSYNETYEHVGGGGGFYGGGASGANSAGGGSSYIASSKLISTSDVTKHMSCYNCETSNDEQLKTITNTCHSSSATSDCAKEGNGFVRITYLGEKRD